MIPGSGRSPGGGHGNPRPYSCPENPMDRGAWRATAHRVTQTQTGLKQLSVNACSPILSLSLSELSPSVDHGESPAEVRGEHLGVAQFMLVTQSCVTLCDPMDCSLPGFPVLTISRSLLKLVSTESVMPSNHLILCRPLLLSSFPHVRVFSSEPVLRIRWAEYWSFSFSIRCG